jgi:hypothetical protein
VYEIITGSAARYNFAARYNRAAHCITVFSMEAAENWDLENKRKNIKLLMMTLV